MPHVPSVTWAQRADSIWVTVQLEKPENLQVDLSADRLKVSASQSGEVFSFELPLFAEILVSESRYSQHRFVEIYLKKKEEEKWPRLSQTAASKLPWLKVDWNRWVDSDAEDEQLGDQQAFDFSNMHNFQQGGDSDDEEQEEDLPDLQQTTAPKLIEEVKEQEKTAA